MWSGTYADGQRFSPNIGPASSLPAFSYMDRVVNLYSSPSLTPHRARITHIPADSPTDGAGETFWRQRVAVDYNFTGSETNRMNGWKFIYQRLKNPRVFTWGYAVFCWSMSPPPLTQTRVIMATQSDRPRRPRIPPEGRRPFGNLITARNLPGKETFC